MNDVSNAFSVNGISPYQNVSEKKTTENKTETKNYGRTIGEPKLSEKAAKYYEQLKSKFSNMNFILVSEDQKENAKANAAKYANANNMVVLVDEAKIEKMAEDEDYRKQIEGVISSAASGISQMASGFANSSNVKGYGMQIDDNGTAQYFAVLEKSSEAQRERIEAKAEENREAKKAEAKKAAKEEMEERLKEASEEDSPYVVIKANSVEELMQRVQDYSYATMSDNVQTEAEKQVGQKFDFSV